MNPKGGLGSREPGLGVDELMASNDDPTRTLRLSGTKEISLNRPLGVAEVMKRSFGNRRAGEVGTGFEPLAECL